MKNGTVTYITHSHSESGCSLGTCRITASLSDTAYTPGGVLYYIFSITHSSCGEPTTTISKSTGNYTPNPSSHSYYTCGYSDGEIIGAEVIFD